MRIKIRKLKVCEWASEETLCMTGEVHVDGKPVAYFDNDGRGGSTKIEPVEGVAWDKIYEVQDQVIKLDRSLASDSPREWLSALDIWLLENAQQKIDEKALKKELRKKIIWQGDNGKWYESKHTTHTQDQEKFKGKIVLNYMPFFDAVKIWQNI